jgi:hypothetical protein
LISGAERLGGPWGWDASPYDAVEYAGDDWLLVGDAGSFVDPLSSAGVKKALASAWLAAVVVNTCVNAPPMKAQALAFFTRREREVAGQLRLQGGRFLADAASGHRHAFWDERADHESSPDDEAAVRACFERLRASDTLAVRVGGAVSVEPRALVRGNQIVMEPHLVTAADPHGVRYVSGIDVVALLSLAPNARQVPDAFDAYGTRVGAAPLPDFLRALATSMARGWLVSE